MREQFYGLFYCFQIIVGWGIMDRVGWMIAIMILGGPGDSGLRIS